MTDAIRVEASRKRFEIRDIRSPEARSELTPRRALQATESRMAPKVNFALAQKRSADRRLLHYDVDTR